MKYDKSTLASIDINVVTEKHPSGDLDVIHFKLKTVTNKTKKYRICTDDRHPDLGRIHQHLLDIKKETQTNFAKIEISEYLERMYIFVKCTGFEQAQYTAQKI